MVRKLALAVSIALGTLNVPAHALGLGELSSKSTLNQNFVGDIGLLSVKPQEMDVLRVRLADATAFSRAGVERPFYLSLLKFTPTTTAKGMPVIRVTSEFPIREPFLNFLIEVNWPNGRLLREYTVLLDPPTTTPRRPPQVAQAVAAPRPPRAVTPAVRSKPVSKPKPAAPKPTVTSVQPSSSPGEYGPVKANETAWSVAKKLRPSGVSMNQMMMALLEANPQAFLNNNINLLRRGRILRVPSLNEIQRMTRREANRAYKAHQDQWIARRDAKLQKAVREKAPPAVLTAAPAESAPAPQDKLQIATARPEGVGKAGAGDDDAVAVSPDASDIKNRLIAARENAETSRQQAEVLRSQVDDLQDRLRDMQKLLSLKDDQLARLQEQVVAEDTRDAMQAGADEAVAGETAGKPDASKAVGEELTVTDAVDQLLADAAAAAEADAEKAAVSDPASATDYRIEDIAPQIDPDLIVEAGGALESAPLEEAMQGASSVVEESIAAMEDSATSMVPGATGEATAQVYDRIQDIAPQVDPDAIVEQADAMAAMPDGEIVVDSTGGDTELVIEGEPVADAATGKDEVVAEQSPVAAVDTQVADAAAPTETMADSEPAKQGLLPAKLGTMIEDNIVPLAAGGVGLLGLLGWLMLRRRDDENDVSEELLATATVASVASADPEEPVDEPAVGKETLSDLPDSSFLDEFSPSEINSLQDETGEVDPVSEADVYIAYGRYQQAEELLLQAMSRDPGRLALKHKLLEVHYATRNADAFSALANEMIDSGQDAADEVAWSRAMDMGREIAPNNEMFAAVGAFGAAAAMTANAAEESELTIDDLDLSQLADEYDADRDPATDLEAPSEVSITLDLEEASQLSSLNENAVLPEAVATDSSGEEAPLSLDDLESLEFELPESESGDAAPAQSDSGVDITDTLDLDSMMAEAEAAVDADDSAMNLDSEFSADELQAQLDELSDLSILETPAADSVSPAEPSSKMGLVAEDLPSEALVTDEPRNLDDAFEVADEDTPELEMLDLEDSSDLASDGVDDVATKLDLARAYVDMGDDDGARSILDEVMAEGSDAQKGEAEQLLAELA